MGFFGRWQLLFGKCYSHFSIVPRFIPSFVARTPSSLNFITLLFYHSTLFFFHESREKNIHHHTFSILTNFFPSFSFFCEKKRYFSMPHISLKDTPVSELFHFSFSFFLFFPPFLFYRLLLIFAACLFPYICIYISFSLSLSLFPFIIVN